MEGGRAATMTMMNGVRGECLNEDLVKVIMERLPAKAVAKAACVCRSWFHAASKLLSTPQFITALSLDPNLEAAMDEVMGKILAKPIRPNFAIAFVGQKFSLSRISTLLKENLGSTIPTVACFATGIIGPDSINNEQKEVKWRQPDYETSKVTRHRMIDEQHGLLVTVGYFPGLEIEAISLCDSFAEGAHDSFVSRVVEYTSSISDHTHPLAMILLADPRADVRRMLESLEEGLHGDTVIIGGLAVEHEGTCLSFNSRGKSKMVHENQSSNTYAETSTSKSCPKVSKAQRRSADICHAVALVFAKKKNDFLDSAKIHFSPAVSAGIAPVGPIYKAVCVKLLKDEEGKETSTWLTCRKEGMPGELDGQSVLDDLDNEVGGNILSEGLYIGVSKRSKFSAGRDKSRVPFTIHEVHGADEEYLFVEGEGIKTGDVFRFYRTDPETGKASSNLALEQVRNHLRARCISNSGHPTTTVEIASNTSNQYDNKVVGAFLFDCTGRGESYFGEPNVESSIFTSNFPDAPLAGMFCLGEIGPPSVISWEAGKRGDTHSRLNFYSSMFLVFSYTLKCVE